jgi:PASTA domain
VLGTGLPTVEVTAVELDASASPVLLRAGTYGRSTWELRLTSPPPPPPPPAATYCRVPKVTGKPLRIAKARMKKAHCRVGRVTYAYSRRVRKGLVLSQSRRPGLRLPPNSRIRLVVSRGLKI